MALPGLDIMSSVGSSFMASNSDAGLRIPHSDPRNHLGTAATEFDALNQIGFGNILDIPSPSRRLVDRITAMPIDEKTKRRGLIGLQDLLAGKEPRFPSLTEDVLSRVGLSIDTIGEIRDQDEQFKKQQSALSDLSGINTSTVLERARSAEAASRLIAGASDFATGNGAMSPLQTLLRDRITRQTDDFEEQALLKGQFGGFNPASALEGINDLRLDTDLRAIEQSLQLASGITGALNGGLGSAQNSANISSNANLGALGIAANQSQAANSLKTQVDLANAQAIQGIVGGSLSTGLTGALAPGAG